WLYSLGLMERLVSQPSFQRRKYLSARAQRGETHEMSASAATNFRRGCRSSTPEKTNVNNECWISCGSTTALTSAAPGGLPAFVEPPALAAFRPVPMCNERGISISSAAAQNDS